MEKPKPVPRRNKNPRRESVSSEEREVKGGTKDEDGSDEILDSDTDRPRSYQKNNKSRKNKNNLPASASTSQSGRVRERLKSRQGTFSIEDDNDLDTSDFRRQIDRLERDLSRRDRELEEERSENEKCMDRIKKLERDKVELKREVEGLKDEGEDYKRTIEDYKERFTRSRKGQAMMDSDQDEDDINHNQQGTFDITLQQKNREIEQLLEDTEKLEDEKKSLEEKLTTLKESLKEATKQIENMANDQFNLKSKLQQTDSKIKQLEEDKAVASIRERELLGFKERHEQYLENLCNAVDIRVDIWKKMMYDKDEEIDRLNSKISALMSQIPNTQMDSERSSIQQLHKKLGDREHQIAILNEQLAQATEEIESNIISIEKLKSKLTLSEDTEKTEKLVKTLQLNLRRCEEKLERKCQQLSEVENEAEEKSHALTSLMSRMHAYESGQYGLPEAVSEIKDLKVQIRIRDKQVEAVTQEINVLQMQVSDLQEECEMLRDKLGLDRDADVSRETKRYTRSRKNELNALRSKVAQFEEEVVQLKTRNYSLRKQINQYEASQQQQSNQPFMGQTLESGFIPERERDRPDGGSVPSPKPGSDPVNHGDLLLKGMTGLGFKPEDWKEKYDIILEENSSLRRGLHEILDCMHKMTDDGTTEVMIQAPVLEELLREMSSRGIINYPYPISSFHMKVCNLEGKCSQLREELHRLRQEERQCRSELFESQGIIKTLTEKLNSQTESTSQESSHPRRPARSRSRSRSPKSSGSKDKRVTFDGNSEGNDVVTNEEGEIPIRRSSLVSTSNIPGRNMVLEDLQQEIEYLRSQNDVLKKNFTQEKCIMEEQLQSITEKANEIFSQKENEPKSQLKIEFLQAIRENQTNEINALIRKLSEMENETTARVGFLERFKMKALHQISIFQQILETSVPIHLLYSAKKELRSLTSQLEELQEKEEKFTINAINFHKNAQEIAELRKERDKFEEELSKCQARLIEVATKLESETPSKLTQSPSPKKTPIITLESQNADLIQKFNHATKMNNLFKSQLEEVEKSKKHIEKQLMDLSEKYSNAVTMQQEAKETFLNTISREEYDLLLNKMIAAEENVVLAKDEILKWKEIAEMTQNQITAIENIKDFEKMELDSLINQLAELQSNSSEKALLAKAHRHMLSADKEKHLAIQQVQKLLSKLSQLEAHSLQQDKIHQEREMALISMHTQVIMRYRSLFAALHESNSPKFIHKSIIPSQDLKEAFEMFDQTQKRCSELEELILEERLKADEFEQKCHMLQSALDSFRDGSEGQEVALASLQKTQEARVEVARWRRKAEQKERECLNLKESVHRLEARTSDLEDDRLRLEHQVELKESLTSALMANKSMENIPLIPLQTLSSTSMPLLSVSSTRFETLLHRPMESKESQTEEYGTRETSEESALIQKVSKDKDTLSDMMDVLKSRISELEASLKAKDDVINDIKFVRSQQERDQRGAVDSDLQDALIVARETITSLQERLKSKDENIAQYRRLLADGRTEMTNATERHVQEMKVLQQAIYAQQQAFTRMKSTLSQPVKDTLSVEGTIKDQLTRIHELEDEVSELQHTMSNTATQLTATRSEANRWRCKAEARMKEADSTREQISNENMEEVHSLKQELRETHRKLETAQQQLVSLKSSAATDSMTELVNVLRNELDEKDKQIEAYVKSLHNLRNSSTFSEKSVLEDRLHSKEKEIESLQEEIKMHIKTIAGLQVKISKTKAINYKSGASTELEELRLKNRELMDEKIKLEKDLSEIERRKEEEHQKKTKVNESVARWEESKKWKKNSEKLESRIKDLESENERIKRTMQNLRITITRMDKEKSLLESKLNARQHNNMRAGSASTADRFSDSSLQSQASNQANILAQGEIARLNMEIQDLKELVEKTEFEGREEAEKLKMEVKLLKERIVTQERQLTAYQIAQKGDSKAVVEIESMAAREAQLQKEIRRLEEDNLHLNLQIEQLRLDTPRLRDRVHHLQRLVEALKAENQPSNQATVPGRSNSQKSLGELEKTINALKLVIEKLQTENKRLKVKPSQSSNSSERIKTDMDGLLGEKKALMDKVHSLEHENEKLTKRYLEANANVESIGNRLQDAEKRAKSAEMKLRTFLGNELQSGHGKPVGEQNISSSYETLVQKMRTMQEELDHKSKLLSAAKQSLRAAEIATAPKPSPSFHTSNQPSHAEGPYVDIDP